MIQEKKQTYGILKKSSINRTTDLPVNEKSPIVHPQIGSEAFQHSESPEHHFLPVQEENKESI